MIRMRVRKGGRDGRGASAVRGDRRLQARRAGVCADPGEWQKAHRVDGDDMGGGDQPARSWLCATTAYWRPFYYLLEEHFEVMLVNACDVKNVPGRKSDASDAAWLADLGAHGLVRASFAPPQPIRVLRDLTRARTAITQERTRENHRVSEAARRRGDRTILGGHRHHRGVGSVDAGRSHRRARGSAVIADLAKRRLRSKIPALIEAFNGHFTAHHAFMAPTVLGSDRRPHR